MNSEKNTYRQEHDVLDAILDNDGIYRVPGLHFDEQDSALRWKYVGGYAKGVYAIGEARIIYVTGV